MVIIWKCWHLLRLVGGRPIDPFFNQEKLCECVNQVKQPNWKKSFTHQYVTLQHSDEYFHPNETYIFMSPIAAKRFF